MLQTKMSVGTTLVGPPCIMDALTSFCLYVEKSRNELALLHLVKLYCLPRLLYYGCEGMLLSTLQTRELDIIWN